MLVGGSPVTCLRLSARAAVVMETCRRLPLAWAGCGSADRDAARQIRLRRNVGPAGARSAGLAQVRTPFVAFVDPDVSVGTPALLRLARHLAADPRLALVGPLVRSRSRGPRPRWFERYDEACSSLSMGPCPSLAGHLVRYEPSVLAEHDTRPTMGAWLGRSIAYGTGGAALAPGTVTGSHLLCCRRLSRSPPGAAAAAPVVRDRSGGVPGTYLAPGGCGVAEHRPGPTAGRSARVEIARNCCAAREVTGPAAFGGRFPRWPARPRARPAGSS